MVVPDIDGIALDGDQISGGVVALSPVADTRSIIVDLPATSTSSLVDGTATLN